MENHHIIPRSRGGKDLKTNLVSLTAREHFLSHWFLSKMFSNKLKKAKMIMAFTMMIMKSQGQSRYRFTSRHFEFLRELRAKSMSILQSGEFNSQYGKTWITNGVINKKIKITDKIEDGWKLGRFLASSLTEKKRIKKERVELFFKNKEEKRQKNEKFYNEIYKIYCEKGWKEVKQIYNHSKPNFVKQCEKYVKTFKPQNGKPRGK